MTNTLSKEAAGGERAMTITDDMVERAAEAMCNEAQHVKWPGSVWGRQSIERQAMYRRYARVAIETALSGQTKEG